MRLLLTRAADDAKRTGALLEAAGHEILISPVMGYVTFPPEWPRRLPHGIIASSARAFSPFSPHDRDETRALPLYLVGRQTEIAARAHGFHGLATVAPDAAALIAAMRIPRGQRLAYLAGIERKPVLEDGIAALGHRLMLIETYGSEPLASLTVEARAAFNEATLDGVLHFSRRSAEIFLDLAAAFDVTRAAHFCLSADVATPLRAAGCRALIAATPDHDGMLAIIRTEG